MQKILIASNNKGKLGEIAKLLNAINIEAISASDFNLIEPEETADNFADNAFIKAKYYGDKINMIALSDDSGLCIPALNNEPGVRSARFAIDENGNKNFELAFEKIFLQLKEKNISSTDKISAFFICNLCLYNPKNNFKINFEGRVDGKLIYPARGNKGFGYDPIFVKENMSQSFGEIEAEFKHQISHRALAFSQLENWLKNNYN
ncbi:MAG: RdgB/HAM1 family non-canonical purine NTP pyrophosphatase, partial [Alphaproteobacteria bacterium]